MTDCGRVEKELADGWRDETDVLREAIEELFDMLRMAAAAVDLIAPLTGRGTPLER